MSRKRIIMISLLSLGALLMVIFIWQLDLGNWQKLDLDKIYDAPLSTSVYDKNGESVGGLYAAENRIYTQLSELPAFVPEAFIAAEDTRFYSHSGIDVRRIFGAIWHDIKTMSYAQGASTITQQLIKLTHLTSEKSISRKLQEAYLAISLEKVLTKDEILEAYLNTVYFGAGAYGIGAAAQVYFGKDASELSLGEAALLAGIIKSPSGYAPHNNPEAALQRREYVLSAMEENGFIDRNEAQKANNEALSLIEVSSETVKYGWYMDETAREAQEILGLSADELYCGGYSIYTGLDKQMQAQAELVMENSDIYPEEAAQGALIAIDPSTGEIRATVGGREYSVRRGLNRSTMAKRQTGSVIKPISTYAAAVDKYEYVPSTIVYDVQREYANGYQPGNSGGQFNGAVTLRTALSRSLNAATVDLADTIGITSVCEYARALGLSVDQQDENLAFSLGSMTYGVTPAEVCTAYCALANGGMLTSAHTIRRIEDKYGNVIYNYSAPQKAAIKSGSAYIITDMLRTAAQTGTAKALSSLDFPVAAKTGTAGLENGDTSDAWTVAYTPEIAVTVWMGLDSNESGGMAASVTGGGYAAPACAQFLERIAGQLSGKDFTVPKELSAMMVDGYLLDNTLEVALISESTPREYAVRELFWNDATPEKTTEIWDAPAPVDDLEISTSSTGAPLIKFTCTDEFAEYVIVRETDASGEVIAILEGDEGAILEYADQSADTSRQNIYTIIPRHKLLFALGKLVTADYSMRAVYKPTGLLGTITGFITDEETEKIESAEYPLF